MSFLRALSSDSLSSNSRSNTSQTQSFGLNSSLTNHHHNNGHPQAPQSTQMGGGHRRHHAKALLHPMSLLLRRRSGQSNHGISEPSPGSYGLARDLPDDFDPGIIYGTRHPDWSFPRRSAPPQTHTILRPESRVQGNSGNGSSSQSKDPTAENVHPRKRQAFFTEHFSDLDTQGGSEHPDEGFEEAPPNDAEAPRPSNAGSSSEMYSVGSNAANITPRLVHGATTADPENHNLYLLDGEPAQWSLVSAEKSDSEEGSSNLLTRYSEIALDPLHNSSRFSFEASSAAESVHGEELSLSENLIQKSQYRSQTNCRRSSSDTASFTSDDIQSITSEDLRDEDGDGFTASFSDFPQKIIPPPGFENVIVDAMENARRLQQIELEEQSDPQPASPNSASIGSSEIGINGSMTEEEEGGAGAAKLEGSNYRIAYPPFVNPPGPSRHGLVAWESGVAEASVAQVLNEGQNSPMLTFHNIFQSAAQGVNEYDSGSPSSFSGSQSLRQSGCHTQFPDEEVEIGDEEDMIAEANRDALASDSDGWYGQEFDFYPSSSTNSTYLAGGFFGIDLPKPGFIRNPSLTPISERSESSLRNSLSLIGPNSIPNCGVSAGPLSTALFTELAKREQLSCDETTLSQLQLLSGTKHPEEAVKHLTLIASAPSAVAPMASLFEGPRTSAPGSAPSTGQLHSLSDFDGSICHHPGGDISTSYVHDTDLGWVMEKRRGGELIQRELVQGAV
ncbi:hypothetical protein TWF569_000815 [Orbilia oligospora]|uniref:Uncharacterized protein n=2 Tax=Orbilia oligospora TaxID=2813651 RepID=A0A7C8MYX0_ORBOL|nr:hypothetical protein TWF102_003611 [Orbilia oligospora]KAF3078574.1 hypothetical protein TWF706_003888 [Orbilia oligospora]KAF3083236.1 hypothetical protein TWF103_003013 [Orbilia oligospora]KAF3125540.1 hypothetical protein TWF569_000815 [Orbilia oligospora]KAF3128607.1 hypothetical protein TWF594_011513 [Orbilia oligospora]